MNKRKTRSKKRGLSVLLAVTLFLTPLFSLADPQESDAVILVDGIRAAFFSDDGSYLPPVTDDGIIYVPAAAFGESMELDVKVDPQTRIVSLGSIRLAFWGDDGAFLQPLDVDGTVYVPLKAFAETAGLSFTAEGNRFSFTREAGQQTAAEPPTVELYGSVPLTLSNYSYYYTFRQNYSLEGGQIVFTLEIIPTTAYEPINVKFRLENYGTVQVFPYEHGKASYRYSDYIRNPRTTAEAGQYVDQEMSAALDSMILPEVLDVSGSMRMSKSEADHDLEALYTNAVSTATSALYSSELKPAIDTLRKLSEIGYRDSGSYIRVAQEREDELRRKEEEQSREKEEQRAQAHADRLAADYDQALSDMENGNYESAVKLLENLAKEQYLDSAERLETAQHLLGLENTYQKGLTAEASEDWGTALDAMQVSADEGYKDAAEHLPGLAEHRIEALTESGETETARQVYEKYRDMLEKEKQDLLLSEIEKKEILTWTAEGKYTEAYQALANHAEESWAQEPLRLCGFRLSSSPGLADGGNILITEQDGTMTLLSPSLQVLQENVPAGTGAWQFDSSGRLANPNIYDSVSAFHNGYAIASREGKQYLIDPEKQETELPAKYTYVCASAPTMICFRTDKDKFGCTDAEGKIIVKAEYDQEILLDNGAARAVKIDTKKASKSGTDAAMTVIFDENGKTILKSGKYIDCYPAGEDRFLVVTGKTKNGLLEKTGQLVDRKGKQIPGTSDMKGMGGQMSDARKIGDYLFVAAGGSWSKGEKVWMFCTAELSVVKGSEREYSDPPMILQDGSLVWIRMAGDTGRVEIYRPAYGFPTVTIPHCEALVLNENSPYLLFRDSWDNCWYLYDAGGNRII